MTTAHPYAGLAERLGLRPDRQRRLDALPAPAAVVLPGDAEAEELLRFCSVGEADRVAMLAARPDPERDEDWELLLAGVVGELLERMDRPLPPEGFATWPRIPGEAGPVGLFVYAWSLVAVVPEVKRAHAARGIPDSVTRSSLACLAGVLSSHREVTGERGVGRFPLWGPPQAFCGADVTIGRHSYTRAVLAVGDGPAGWVLQVHVPPTGPLGERASEESMDEAISFFARHYPEEPISALVCRSWLLDPQLDRFLPSTSRISRFRRRFDLIPHVPLVDAWADDREMMRLGLQLPTPDSGELSTAELARVPRRTSLERGFVELITSGGHWHKRTGIRWLGSDAADRRSA